MEEKILATVKETAYHLKCSVAEVYRLTQLRVLKVQRTENGNRYDLNDLFR